MIGCAVVVGILAKCIPADVSRVAGRDFYLFFAPAVISFLTPRVLVLVPGCWVAGVLFFCPRFFWCCGSGGAARWRFVGGCTRRVRADGRGRAGYAGGGFLLVVVTVVVVDKGWSFFFRAVVAYKIKSVL